jgi:hypothetical protein
LRGVKCLSQGRGKGAEREKQVRLSQVIGGFIEPTLRSKLGRGKGTGKKIRLG